MTVLSLAELEKCGEERGAEGLVKIAVRLREIALRASVEKKDDVEKLALEVAKELEAFECENCRWEKDEREEAEDRASRAEDENERLEKELDELKDANSCLNDEVTDLTEELRQYRAENPIV